MREIRSLTGLRGVSAVWVMLFHAFYCFPFMGTPLDWLTSAGYMGVDVFFVLSGFVLAHNYADTEWNPRSYGAFLRKRFARVYPAHFFMLLVFVLLAWGAAQIDLRWISPVDLTSVDLLRSVLLVHAWEPQPYHYPWNGPSWTISAEWLAYMTFPLVVMAVQRVRDVALLVLLCIVLFALYAVHAQLPFGQRLPQLASCFISGVALWRVAARTPSTPLDTKLAWLLLLVLILGSSGSNILAMRPVAGERFAIVAAAVVYFIARSENGVSRFLSTPFMNYLGRISYSLYLVHILFMYLSDLLIDRTDMPRAWAIRLGAIALTWLAAHCLYTFVEEPCRRAIVRWGNSRATPAGTAQPRVAG